MQAHNPTTYEYHYDEPAPVDVNGQGVEVLVPGNVKERLVWASIEVVEALTGDTRVSAEVETGAGTGVFMETGIEWRESTGAVVYGRGTFHVPGGRKYRIRRTSGGQLSSTIVGYGYRDEI